MQPCHFNFLYADLKSLSNRDYTEPELLASYVRLHTPWATEQTYRPWKTINMKLDMCDVNVQKHQFSNLPAY